MKINYLVIEGNIGSGKTTLSKMIAQDFGASTILERFDDNPFLPKFYKDRDKYAFPLEMSFLADRYHQLTKNSRDAKFFSSFSVSDYYLIKSRIFALTTLSADEYHLYNRFFKMIIDKIPKPDLYVYLHVDAENLLKNIRKRGREYEQAIDIEYLERIRQGYFNFLSHQKEYPILVIDINQIDFVANPEHYRLLVGTIFDTDYQPGVNRILMG